MKTPSLDLRALADWLVRHGEKLVVAVVGVVAVALMWSGFSALRTSSVTESQSPQALERISTQAGEHIMRDRQPPADLLPPREALADAIDPWRTAAVPWKTGTAAGLKVAAAMQVAELDRPLFEELAKRSRPEVLPVENLRAVAGLAILPAEAAAPGGPGGPGGLDEPPRAPPAGRPAKPPKPEPGRGRKPPRGGDRPDTAPDPMLRPAEPLAAAAGAAGRIVPYVVVTGLIPAAKQKEEYRQRFENCGFRDQQRDTPLWSDFEIERGVVGRDGAVQWKTIDLAAVSRRRGMEPGVEVAAAAPELQLGTDEARRSVKTTPVEFCAPVPRRIDRPWELDDLHPWVVEWMAEKLAEEARRREQGPRDPADFGPGREGPGFGDTEDRPGEPVAPELEPERPAFRFFRFVDTDVEPGRTYRYRVRLKVWNPNYHKDPEQMRPHLTDPALAVDPKLTSPDAETAVAATVPDETRVLVGTLRTEEIKELRLKPGTLEVLVLGPSENTGSFALRGIVGDAGALIDIEEGDEKLGPKTVRERFRGEKITTGRVLLDARGRQEERGGSVDKGKPDAIAEPLEVICLKPDGSFEFASIDGSARLIGEYGRTLPPRGTKADAGFGEGVPVDQPADLLLAPSGAKR